MTPTEFSQVAAGRDAIPATILSARRVTAWLGLTAGLGMMRLSVKCLPKGQPIRIFVEGFAHCAPFRPQDLPHNLGVRCDGGDDDPTPRATPAAAR